MPLGTTVKKKFLRYRSYGFCCIITVIPTVNHDSWTIPPP